MVLGGAFSNLGRLARSPALGQGRHGRGLATQGLPNLLGQSVAGKKGRSAASEFAAPRVNPADGGRQPVLGAPRLHGELLKLGIAISERTVSRLMPKKRKPPSQTWRAFLNNHVQDLVSVDFFTVPRVSFRVLLCLSRWLIIAAASFTST